MKLLQKKLKNKKGFTLIEMLVVIAIIAILVAISIPMVSGALEKAREAADDANLQAAKAVAMVCAMDGKISNGTTITADGSTKYYYDVANGTIVNSTTGLTDQSKGQSSANTNPTKYIVITFATTTRDPSVGWNTP